MKGEEEMDIIIRNETSKDYHEVEVLTREAFWNVYRPGCNEHLVTHKLRKSPSFIKELDFVIEKEGEIVGTIIYSYVNLTLDNGEKKQFICFGPVGIRPDCQGLGLGKKLILHSLEEAKKLGYTAVFITGNHNFYNPLGFESASKYGIYLDDNRNGEFTFFMVNPLVKGALDGINGILTFDSCFDPSTEETEQFDSLFTPKVKEKRPGQFE